MLPTIYQIDLFSSDSTVADFSNLSSRSPERLSLPALLGELGQGKRSRLIFSDFGESLVWKNCALRRHPVIAPEYVWSKNPTPNVCIYIKNTSYHPWDWYISLSFTIKINHSCKYTIIPWMVWDTSYMDPMTQGNLCFGSHCGTRRMEATHSWWKCWWNKSLLDFSQRPFI